MKNRDPRKIIRCFASRLILLLLLSLFVSYVSVASERHNYQLGSRISSQVVVSDKLGVEQRLTDLVATSQAKISVVFIFGGGALGHERAAKSGGLWCSNSFEDLHIVRSLHKFYENKVGIIPIAVPPAHHSHWLGFEKGVFFTGSENASYQKAIASFVDSTQASIDQGTIPVQPFYDSGFNLLADGETITLRRELSLVPSWAGAFRSKNEAQEYDVPNLWLVDPTGKIVAEPFRGDIYRPHAGEISIRYTLKDVIAAIDTYLQNRSNGN